MNTLACHDHGKKPVRKMTRVLLVPVVYVFTMVLLNNVFAATPLEDVQWRLVELAGSPPDFMEGREPPALFFDSEDENAMGYSGCNHYLSQYTLKGSTLTFGPIAATRRACTDLENATETNFLTALLRTSRWEIEDGELSLFSGGNVLARFKNDNPM
jgi:heat shock protein HslJ